MPVLCSGRGGGGAGGSPAQLEHAKARIDLGAALRRAGHRAPARHQLRHGAELALVCGAHPQVDRARTELRATGARPLHLSGPAALTPSERRVAELAAAGHSNRYIDQTLFITPPHPRSPPHPRLPQTRHHQPRPTGHSPSALPTGAARSNPDPTA